MARSVKWFVNLGLLIILVLQPSAAEASLSPLYQASPAVALEHFRQGDAFYQKRQFERAVEESRKAVLARRDFIEAHDLEGLALTALGRFEEAEVAFKEALRINPKYAKARSDLSFAYYQQNKMEHAGQEAAAVLTLNPEEPIANFVAGMASYAAHDFVAVATHLERAEQITGKSPEALFALANIFLHQHRKESGLKRLRQISQLPNLSSANQFELGRYYDAYGLYEEAGEVFGKLRTQFPTSFEAKYNLALANFHQGKTLEARELLEQMRDQNPRAEIHDLLAACYEKLNDIPVAGREYVRAIDLDPQNENYYLRLAFVALLRAAYNFGVAELRIGLKRLPGSYRIRWMLGTLEDGYGNAAEAEHWFREAISVNPKYNVSWALLALFLARRERLPEAFETLHAAIGENPRDYLMPYIWALILHQNQKDDASVREAKDWLKRSIELNPNFIETRYLLGRFYLDAGDISASQRELEKAQTINPDHYGTNLLLIRVYRKRGEHAKAEEAEKLLKEGRKRLAFERTDPTDESVLSLQMERR